MYGNIREFLLNSSTPPLPLKSPPSDFLLKEKFVSTFNLYLIRSTWVRANILIYTYFEVHKTKDLNNSVRSLLSSSFYRHWAKRVNFNVSNTKELKIKNKILIFFSQTAA